MTVTSLVAAYRCGARRRLGKLGDVDGHSAGPVPQPVIEPTAHAKCQLMNPNPLPFIVSGAETKPAETGCDYGDA